MNTLRLYGELGKKFGKVHRYNTTSIPQTLRLLFINYPELRLILLGPNKDAKYKISVDTEVLSIPDLVMPINNKTIRITPIISGAGSDEAKIVGGVVLVAVGMWLAGPTGALAGSEYAGLGVAVGGIAVNVGMALVYGGISGLLYVPPKEPVGNPSKTFDGAINTTRQGVCVPLGYGMCIVGSATISAGITNS